MTKTQDKPSQRIYDVRDWKLKSATVQLPLATWAALLACWEAETPRQYSNHQELVEKVLAGIPRADAELTPARGGTGAVRVVDQAVLEAKEAKQIAARLIDRAAKQRTKLDTLARKVDQLSLVVLDFLTEVAGHLHSDVDFTYQNQLESLARRLKEDES